MVAVIRSMMANLGVMLLENIQLVATKNCHPKTKKFKRFWELTSKMFTFRIKLVRVKTKNQRIWDHSWKTLKLLESIVKTSLEFLLHKLVNMNALYDPQVAKLGLFSGSKIRPETVF